MRTVQHFRVIRHLPQQLDPPAHREAVAGRRRIAQHRRRRRRTRGGRLERHAEVQRLSRRQHRRQRQRTEGEATRFQPTDLHTAHRHRRSGAVLQREGLRDREVRITGHLRPIRGPRRGRTGHDVTAIAPREEARGGEHPRIHPKEDTRVIRPARPRQPEEVPIPRGDQIAEEALARDRGAVIGTGILVQSSRQHRHRPTRGELEDGPRAIIGASLRSHPVEVPIAGLHQAAKRPHPGRILIEVRQLRQHARHRQLVSRARVPEATGQPVEIPVAAQQQMPTGIAARHKAIEVRQLRHHARRRHLESRARASEPAAIRHPIKVSTAHLHQIALGIRPDGQAVEVRQLRQHACHRHLEGRALLVRPARVSQPIEIPIAPQHQATLGPAPGGVLTEFRQHRQFPCRRHLEERAIARESRAVSIDPADGSQPVEVPIDRLHQPAGRIAPRAVFLKVRQLRHHTVHRHLEGRPIVIGPAGIRQPIEVPIAPPDQVSGLRPSRRPIEVRQFIDRHLLRRSQRRESQRAKRQQEGGKAPHSAGAQQEGECPA